jgi:hypothetical protein
MNTMRRLWSRSRGVLRLLEQEGRHRAEQEGGGDFELPYLVPKRFGAKMAHHRDRTSDAQRYSRDERAADMEDRHVQ